MSDRKIDDVITEMVSMFRPPMSSKELAVYYRALGDYTLAEVEHACKLAIDECERLPAPARIRKIIAESAGKPKATAPPVLCTTHAQNIDIVRRDGGVPWCSSCRRHSAERQRGMHEGLEPGLCDWHAEGKPRKNPFGAYELCPECQRPGLPAGQSRSLSLPLALSEKIVTDRSNVP